MKNNEIEKPLITLGEYISDFAEVGDKFLSGEYREKGEEAVYVVVSDFRKKLTIQEWLRKKLNKIVIIKNIIDQEDFLKNVVEIKSIYLSSVPDLFSRMGFLREILDDDVNNFGTAINNVELTVHFTKNNLPVKLIEKIKYFIRQKESGAFKKLQITGRSDEVFDRVFNTDGIIDKVSIIVPQSDSGLLDSKIVFSRLIEKIK